jgi:hypothetical protein
VKRISILFSLSSLLVAALTGCVTTPAPDVAGRWRSVNRFAEVPQEIPLYKTYVFYASPLDGTLKTTLERWCKDSKMTLSYLHPSDFTLYTQVEQVRTTNLQDALAQLTAAYAAQGVSITQEQNQIVVKLAETSAASGSATTVNP